MSGGPKVLVWLLLSVVGILAVRMPNVVDSNMVLQRKPLGALLWGWTNKSDTVKVSLNGQVVGQSKADANGTWWVTLAQPEGGPHTILVADSVNTVTLTNIMFGDVYLCSGQSNMAMSVNNVFDAYAEIQDSINYPNIRMYSINNTVAYTPQYDGISKANYRWGVSGPASFQPVMGLQFSWFSATCYFFGRDLYKALDGKVPIGLVASDWGGQRIECFMSPDALADTTCGGTVKPGTFLDFGEENEEISAPGKEWAFEGPNPTNSQLWYGQIYPFLPMRFTGVTWYQGESNAGDPTGYACSQPAMVADWRLKFKLPNLSFFFVQLAADRKSVV